MRTRSKIDHTINPSSPYNPPVVGTYLDTIEANGKKRSMISYLPAELRAAAAGIIVLPDNGISAREMLDKSNWADLAETDDRKEKFAVYFLEADHTWNLDNPEDDLSYVYEAYLKARQHDKCIIHESKCYLVGYGAGGTIAQMSAMDRPAIWAGVASVDAPEIQPEYAENNGNLPCTDLDGYEDPTCKYKYQKQNFLVPSWIISNRSLAETAEDVTAKYWRKAADTVENPHLIAPDTIEFIRQKPAPWAINQEKQAFRVWISQINGASENYGYTVNRRIWTDFLRGVRRWMADPGGDLRITKDPVLDLQMEYHYEEIGGWMREYYVHVPLEVRNNPEKPVPLVFALHGFTCSGEIYIGNSEWNKVADTYGFIVVFPSAVHGPADLSNRGYNIVKKGDVDLPAWNIRGTSGPDEMLFFETMLNRVSASYPVDKSRVFATGHSMGSLMVQYLGMAKPELLTAIAPCSGVLFSDSSRLFPETPEVKNRQNLRLPVWMFGGEKEEWIMKAIPEADNDTGLSIYIWWKLNHMAGAKPNNFEIFRKDNGRWKDYCFYDDHIPMIRYTWIEELPHATMPEMSFRIWEEFFSKFTRAIDGTIIFDQTVSTL